MFERVMRALKAKNLPIATGAIAYATDDVISKVMGENVLPGLMKKAGTDVKLSVTFQTQARYDCGAVDMAAAAATTLGTTISRDNARECAATGIGNAPDITATEPSNGTRCMH